MIPLVFHLVLPEDVQGPSDTQLLSQVDALNENFQRLQSIQLVPTLFRSRLTIPHIQFCLASEDPSGAPHSGISRTTTGIQNIGQHFFSDGRQSVHHTLLGGKDAWDTERYLNIWVAEMTSFVGRASFPESGRKEEDGIVIDPDFIGKIGVPNQRFSEGKTLVHEVGHYLNLLHPWGDSGCETDDGLMDTPLQESPYFGCASPSNSRSCGTLDMVQNFMQFGDDPCLLYFTKEQVEMMRSILLTSRSKLIENGARICNRNQPNQEDNVQIFYARNPERIFIRGLQNQRFRIQVFNISGQLAHNFEVQDRYTTEINASSFPIGIYVVIVKGNEGLIKKKVAVLR